MTGRWWWLALTDGADKPSGMFYWRFVKSPWGLIRGYYAKKGSASSGSRPLTGTQHA